MFISRIVELSRRRDNNATHSSPSTIPDDVPQPGPRADNDAKETLTTTAINKDNDNDANPGSPENENTRLLINTADNVPPGGTQERDRDARRPAKAGGRKIGKGDVRNVPQYGSTFTESPRGV